VRISNEAKFTYYRLATFATRFLFIVFLTYKYDISDVGIYGLWSSIIVYFSILSALDLYSFSERGSWLNRNGSLYFGNHIYLVMLSTLIFSPVILLLLNFYLVPWSIQVLILIIIFLEVCSIELIRFLNFIGFRLQSSVAIFFKSSLWVYFFIACAIFWDLPIESIFYFWSLGGVLATVYSVIIVSHSGSSFTVSNFFSYIRQTLARSIPFFIGGLFLKSFFILDKLIISNDPHALGSYVVFSSIALGSLSLIDVFVYSRYYPRVLFAFTLSSHSFIRYVRFFTKITAQYCFSLSLILIVLILAFFELNVSLEYRSYKISAILLIVSFLLYYLSFVGHYILYSMKMNRIVFVSNFLSVAPLFSLWVLGHASFTDLTFTLFLSSFLLFSLKSIFSIYFLRGVVR